MSTTSFISHNIYEKLKEDILTLQLKPGQVLSENETAKLYHASRTPVHNAFAQLKAENLVDVLPQRGTLVSLLDWDYIQQIIYMRTQVEIAIFSDVIYNWKEELEQPITENLNKQYEIIADETKLAEFYTLSNEFHEIFYDFVGKKKLWNAITSLQHDYTRYRYLLYSVEQRRLDMYHDHVNLFNLVRDKNVAAIHRFIPYHHPMSGDTFPTELEQYRDYFFKDT